MKVAKVHLKSVSEYSQSQYLSTPKLPKELHDDYEQRVWRDRVHATADGECFIPPMAFKSALAEAAKFMSKPIPGKGKQTWTKHFDAGVLVVDALPLGVNKEDVDGEWLLLNADGRRGGGTRVKRCMPVFREWAGDLEFLILDDTITRDVFMEHLHAAGSLIGIGRFRPRNGGFKGRFSATLLEWRDNG